MSSSKAIAKVSGFANVQNPILPMPNGIDAEPSGKITKIFGNSVAVVKWMSVEDF
jgi:hypothetical protein